MTRRRKRGRQDDGGNSEKGTNPTFYVPLEKWQKFQRFLNCEEQIEEAVSDLRRAWEEHVALIWSEYRTDAESEDMEDNFQRIQDIMRAICYSPAQQQRLKKNKHHKNHKQYSGDYSIYPPVNHHAIGTVKPNFNKVRVATIIIDISDGML
jgi:hypothetical protein